MKHVFLPLAAIAFLAAPLGAAPKVKSVPNPDFTKGEKIPAAAKHDWNLGATGARGWMYVEKLVTNQARQIAITKVEKGSPADGVLAVGDVGAQHTGLAVVDEAVHRRDRALEREHDRVHRDLVGGAREDIASVRAACGLHETGLLEQGGDALEIREREVLGVGDGLERDRVRAALEPELDQQPDPILRLRREDHGR